MGAPALVHRSTQRALRGIEAVEHPMQTEGPPVQAATLSPSGRSAMVYLDRVLQACPLQLGHLQHGPGQGHDKGCCSHGVPLRALGTGHSTGEEGGGRRPGKECGLRARQGGRPLTFVVMVAEKRKVLRSAGTALRISSISASKSMFSNRSASSSTCIPATQSASTARSPTPCTATANTVAPNANLPRLSAQKRLAYSGSRWCKLATGKMMVYQVLECPKAEALGVTEVIHKTPRGAHLQETIRHRPQPGWRP